MKYYKDTSNKLYAFEDNVTQDTISKVEATHNTTLTSITRTEYQQAIAPTFQELQQAKIQELYKAYELANQEDINYMNTIFDTKQATQDIIAKNLAIGSVPNGFYFRDIYNNNIPMTYTDLQGLGQAIQSRNLMNFQKLQTLKEQVNLAVTLNELEAIKW